MRRYVQVLGVPRVARLLLAAGASRTAVAMLGLALVLAVTAETNLARGGLALGVYSVSICVGAPVAGRWVDRRGAQRVLVGYLLVHLAGYVVLLVVLLTSQALAWVLLACVLVGASAPPTSVVLRGTWPRLVPDRLLSTVYALDSAENSAAFVLGPLVVGVVASVATPQDALIVAAVVRLLGDAFLVVGLRSGSDQTTGSRNPLGRLGPLRVGSVRILLVVMALDTVGFGCLDIAAVASGHTAVGYGLIGVLLAAISVGEVLGGLGYGVRELVMPVGRQLVLAHLAGAVLLSVTGFVSLPLLLVVGFVIIGSLSGLRDAANQVGIAAFSPAELRVETFAWSATAMWAGFAVGSAVAGPVQESFGTRPVFLLAATAAGFAALLSLRLGPRTRRAR